MCVTDRHDMTLAVKVALNLNTTNQPTIFSNATFFRIDKTRNYTVRLKHQIGLIQQESLRFNTFPSNALFLRVFCTILLKTLWEKEKLLLTSNFSFFHSVFYPFRELIVIYIKLKTANSFSLEVSKDCRLEKGSRVKTKN